MASLKDLRDKIASVKATQKITKAMQMVSASKFKKAQQNASSFELYAKKMDEILGRALVSTKTMDDQPYLLKGTGGDVNHLLIVIGPDKGLCGALNTNLVKMIREKIITLKSFGKNVKIFCIGKKVYEFLKKDYAGSVIEKCDFPSPKALNFASAEEFSKKFISLFSTGTYDICTIIYMSFNSVLLQTPLESKLLPVSGVVAEDAGEYTYEPFITEALDELLPNSVSIQLYRSLLNTLASEYAARMSAMDNATRNAADMIKKQTLLYNRTRQAAITKELIEIISGAECV